MSEEKDKNPPKDGRTIPLNPGPAGPEPQMIYVKEGKQPSSQPQAIEAKPAGTEPQRVYVEMERIPTEVKTSTGKETSTKRTLEKDP